MAFKTVSPNIDLGIPSSLTQNTNQTTPNDSQSKRTSESSLPNSKTNFDLSSSILSPTFNNTTPNQELIGNEVNRERQYIALIADAFQNEPKFFKLATNETSADLAVALGTSQDIRQVVPLFDLSAEPLRDKPLPNLQFLNAHVALHNLTKLPKHTKASKEKDGSSKGGQTQTEHLLLERFNDLKKACACQCSNAPRCHHYRCCDEFLKRHKGDIELWGDHQALVHQTGTFGCGHIDCSTSPESKLFTFKTIPELLAHFKNAHLSRDQNQQVRNHWDKVADRFQSSLSQGSFEVDNQGQYTDRAKANLLWVQEKQILGWFIERHNRVKELLLVANQNKEKAEKEKGKKKKDKEVVSVKKVSTLDSNLSKESKAKRLADNSGSKLKQKKLSSENDPKATDDCLKVSDSLWPAVSESEDAPDVDDDEQHMSQDETDTVAHFTSAVEESDAFENPDLRTELSVSSSSSSSSSLPITTTITKVDTTSITSSTRKTDSENLFKEQTLLNVSGVELSTSGYESEKMAVTNHKRKAVNTPLSTPSKISKTSTPDERMQMPTKQQSLTQGQNVTALLTSKMKHAIALVSTDIVKNFVKPDKFSTSSTSSVLSSIITSKSVIQLAENNFLSCQSGLGRLWACTTADSKVFRFFTNLSEPIVLFVNFYEPFVHTLVDKQNKNRKRKKECPEETFKNQLWPVVLVRLQDHQCNNSSQQLTKQKFICPFTKKCNQTFFDDRKKLLNHLYNKHHNEQQTVQCTANDDNCFAKSMNFLYSQFTHHSMIYHQVNVYKCVHQKCFEGTLVFGTLIEVANHYNSAHADVKDWEKLCTSLIGNVSEPANMFVEKTVPANDDVLMNDDETGDRAANSMLENEEHETMDQDNCSATVCQTSNENKKKFRKTKKGVVLRNAPVSPPGFTLPTVVTSPKQNCAKSNPIFLQSTSKGKPLSTTIEHSAEHLNSKKEEEKRRKRKAVQSSVLPIAKLPNLGSKTTGSPQLPSNTLNSPHENVIINDDDQDNGDDDDGHDDDNNNDDDSLSSFEDLYLDMKEEEGNDVILLPAVEEVSLPGKLSINSATSVLTVQPQLPPDTLLNEFSQRNYALWKTPLSKAFRFFTPSHALSATSANCSQNMPKMLIYVNLSFCRVGLFKDKDAVGLDTCYDGGNGDCVHDHIRPVLVQGLSGLSVEEVKESREPLPQHVFQQKLLVQWRRLRSIFQNSASGSDRRLKKEFQEQEADLTDDHRRLLCPFADQCKQLSFVSRFELQRHFFERHYLIRNGFTCTTADSCASSGALYSYADWSHHQAIYHLKGRYYCAKLGCGHSNLRPIETIAGVLRHYDLAHSGTNLWERFVSQIRLLDFSYSCAEGATEQNHDRQKCPQCKEERQKEAKWIQRQSSRFEESTTWFSKTEDD